MVIPDDVKIVFNGDYSRDAISHYSRCIRDIPDTLWVNWKGYFRYDYGESCVVAGHFVRTVKTRRVVWDLVEGINIDPALKAELEAFALASKQTISDHPEYIGKWKYVVGESPFFRRSSLVLEFHFEESVEEIPWSPFNVDRKEPDNACV